MGDARSGYTRAVDRRRFLALFGMGGAAAIGVGAAATTGTSSAEATEDDPRLEQEDTPNGGTHRVIWSVETTEAMASLTFDDGPDPDYTPAILDILDDYGVRATFFMMGWNAMVHSHLARRVVDAGHEIGNHTWSHQNLTFTSPEETFEEMHRAAEVLEDVAGTRPRFFRPPRGQLSGFSIRHATMLGYDTIIWSVTPGEVSKGGPTAVRRDLARRIGPGDIVDLHDGVGRGTFNPGRDFTDYLHRLRTAEIEALPRVIEDALDRGLEFGTVSDLLAVEAPHSVQSAPVRPTEVVPPDNGGAKE